MGWIYPETVIILFCLFCFCLMAFWVNLDCLYHDGFGDFPSELSSAFNFFHYGHLKLCRLLTHQKEFLDRVNQLHKETLGLCSVRRFHVRGNGGNAVASRNCKIALKFDG